MTLVLAWRTHGSCGAAFFPGVRSELFVYAWLHEVKFDGYRIQVHKVGSRVVIYSRNGRDFTERFPSIAQLLHELPVKAAVLNVEAVASDADGRPNFARLRVRWARPRASQLWAFDLLALNSRDLRLRFAWPSNEVSRG